jgi:hypothetical protein
MGLAGAIRGKPVKTTISNPYSGTKKSKPENLQTLRNTIGS